MNHLRQFESKSCGYVCVAMILEFHQHPRLVDELMEKYSFMGEGVSLKEMFGIFNDMKMNPKLYQWNHFRSIEKITPLIMRISLNSEGHFVVVWKSSHGFLLISDPAESTPQWVHISDLEKEKTKFYGISTQKKVRRTDFWLQMTNLFQLAFQIGFLLSSITQGFASYFSLFSLFMILIFRGFRQKKVQKEAFPSENELEFRLSRMFQQHKNIQINSRLEFLQTLFKEKALQARHKNIVIQHQIDTLALGFVIAYYSPWTIFFLGLFILLIPKLILRQFTKQDQKIDFQTQQIENEIRKDLANFEKTSIKNQNDEKVRSYSSQIRKLLKKEEEWLRRFKNNQVIQGGVLLVFGLFVTLTTYFNQGTQLLEWIFLMSILFGNEYWQWFKTKNDFSI